MLGDLIFFRIDLDLQLLRWLDKNKKNIFLFQMGGDCMVI